MTSSKRGYQFGSPVLVPSLDDDAQAQTLKRIRLSAATDAQQAYDEAWVQRLIHRNPSMLPVAELEPSLGALIPVAMELPMASGYLDNLFVTCEGHLVLVECKLWRNPEARRRVIAQVMDYAQNVSGWSYEQLDGAIKKVGNRVGNETAGLGLFDIVQRGCSRALELDEADFVDSVQRNLTLGRMLLLVVGDGIREDTESLKDFLQQHAGFHFTLALVETALYEIPQQSGFVVQARVLARTLNIERAVVRLVDGRLSATAAKTIDEARPVAPRSLSEEAYFEKLSASDPTTATSLSSFAVKLRDFGVFLDVATKSAALKWESPSGRQFTLAAVDLTGRLVTYSVCWGPKQLGHVEIGHNYLRHLAELIGAHVRQTKSDDQWYIVANGTTMPPAGLALQKQDEWTRLIAEYQRTISEAEARSGET